MHLSATLPRTAIGSLPGVDPAWAIAQHQSLEVPACPELPATGDDGTLLGLALAGLPGVRWEGGLPVCDEAAWRSSGESAEPASHESALWQGFLDEVGRRRPRLAKVQVAGPLTVRRALLGAGPAEWIDLAIRRAMARGSAMAREVARRGARPVVFLDEPWLHGLSPDDPLWHRARAELEQLVTSLRVHGAMTGLHSCGEVAPELLLSLPVELLAIDTALMLPTLLASPALEPFVALGGRLVLGVVPTDGRAMPTAQQLADEVVLSFTHAGQAALLRSCWLSPACGLAGLTVDGAMEALATLESVQRQLLAVIKERGDRAM